jgi:hypothetical protein
MGGSFVKRRSGLKSPAQLRNLLLGQGPRRKLLQRTESDAIGFAQSAVDGAGFGHAHLGVVEDQGRDVAGMGIAVADEAAALGRLIDGRLENPEVLFGAAKGKDWLGPDRDTVAASGEA